MPLDYTGERLVPEQAEGYSFWEHVYRYRFALGFARGRTILDIACGEGYGTAALATVAHSAIGVDISAETVEHARTRYKIDTRLGSAEAIPITDGAAEVVVSFETIEHLQSPAVFIRECHRVLAPGGQLIISTPNREVYSSGGHHNEFHVKEMSEEEFADVLSPHFTPTGWYSQCSTAGSSCRFRDAFNYASPWTSNVWAGDAVPAPMLCLTYLSRRETRFGKTRSRRSWGVIDRERVGEPICRPSPPGSDIRIGRVSLPSHSGMTGTNRSNGTQS